MKVGIIPSHGDKEDGLPLWNFLITKPYFRRNSLADIWAAFNYELSVHVTLDEPGGKWTRVLWGGVSL